MCQWPAGKRPPESSIWLAIAPPRKKPLANGWRMLRERYMSFSITLSSTASWYDERSSAFPFRFSES